MGGGERSGQKPNSKEDEGELKIVELQDKRKGVVQHEFYSLLEHALQVCQTLKHWFKKPEDALVVLKDLAEDYANGALLTKADLQQERDHRMRNQFRELVDENAGRSILWRQKKDVEAIAILLIHGQHICLFMGLESESN